MIFIVSVSSFKFARGLMLNSLRFASVILEKSDHNFIQISQSNHEQAILTYSDGSTFFEQIIECIHIEIKDRMYVDRDLLHNLLRVLDSDAEVSVSEYDNNVIIEYNSGRKNSKTLSNTHIIEMPEIKGVSIDLDTVDFINKLKFARHAVSLDEIRHQFRGISFKIHNGKESLWASNGYKIAIIENDCHIVLNDALQCILPKKLVDFICSFEYKEKLHMIISDSHVRVQIANLTIISPLINATPFDYSPIMKFRNETPHISLQTSPAYLVKMIEQALISCDKYWIKLAIDDEYKLITSNVIKASEETGCEKLNKELVKTEGQGHFYIDGVTTMGFLKQIKDEVRIEYYQNNKTIVVRPSNDKSMFYLSKTISKTDGN